MDNKRFRVTASVGGRKSIPWPFGILDIGAEKLRLRSSLMSWWVKGHDFDFEEVKSVSVLKRFGTTRVHVAMNDGSQLKAELVSSPEAVVRTLGRFGYRVNGE
jgi:hypothetical protein